MKDEKKGLTRRDLIRGAAGVTLAGALSTWGLGRTGKAAAVESLCSGDPGARPGRCWIPTTNRIPDVLAGDARFRGENPFRRRMTRKAAWRKAIRPTDTVGIKSNVWSYLRTPPALREDIIVKPGHGVRCAAGGQDFGGRPGHQEEPHLQGGDGADQRPAPSNALLVRDRWASEELHHVFREPFQLACGFLRGPRRRLGTPGSQGEDPPERPGAAHAVVSRQRPASLHEKIHLVRTPGFW